MPTHISQFKTITRREQSVTDSTRHKSITVKDSTDGVFSAQYRLPHEWKNKPTGSKDVGWSNNGEYWYWLYSNIYVSGSSHSEDFITGSLHNTLYGENSYTYQNQFVHKFNNSGSLISIPTIYFGDMIKPGSLILQDNSKSSTITIKDDGNGNLYSIGNTISASNTSPSSSDNYIGNIFYEIGLINITDTGSYTTGIKYTDIGDNYTASFKSTLEVKTHEYRLHTRPGEFCNTNNHTIMNGWAPDDYYPLSGSIPSIGDQFTSSGFLPYVTTIGLYDDDHNLVAVGKLPNPQKRSLTENITYVLKFDI
tara:strand:+ start:1649 stop:2572 length:924 start_codon:yes stop_codon:yes gene_type:complete